MPTIEQNKARWTTFAWGERGDEWSHGWGGSQRLWHQTVWPRIGAFLPAGTILEIAPGHGRMTQYLLGECARLVVVDLVAECIEACRGRFAGHEHIEYHVNDGRTLAMVAGGSVDVGFSWDSMVHVERDALSSYLRELGRVLRPGGVAFLHHSNMREHRHRFTGKLRVENPHWRAESVGSGIVRRDARTAGLAVLVQEIIPWGGTVLNDCLTLLRRPAPGDPEVEPVVVANHAFGHEVSLARRLGALYSGDPSALNAHAGGRASDGVACVRWGSGGRG